MTWTYAELLLATGFMGGLTTLVWGRWLYHKLIPVPTMSVTFSPKGGCTEAAVREINAARNEILVMAYSFTSKEIADAIIAAKKRGVRVDILLDHSNEKETYTELPLLEEHGMLPLIDAQHAIAHNKVIIIDHKTIITGSFNFTHQAEHQNAENMLVIKGHPELVSAYYKNFGDHKGHCRQPEAKPVTKEAKPAGEAKPAAHHKAA
jgi:phosphatidylserine/phosphatidylglycerophosphate/cardiolipin synthase-like enzyme